MTENRFDRQTQLFAATGQARIRAARAVVVGAGGLGSHVVQQLTFLGIGSLAVIDADELALSNLNRLIGARHDDPIPGTPKVMIARRQVLSVDPGVRVDIVQDSVVCTEGFAALRSADWVFGCVDRDGVRLILTEFCVAYNRPYIDLATEISTDTPVEYGGRVMVTLPDRPGCLCCMGELDLNEARRDFAGPGVRREEDRLYGLLADDLGGSGPSVVCINGVVVSVGLTEFMVGVTGLRQPKRLLRYRGSTGVVSAVLNEPPEDCYYCRGLSGQGDAADLNRYLREGVGTWLR